MRRRITLVAATVAALVLPATAASALHCPHPHKPAGAGAVDPFNPSEAGNSGKHVYRGGFIDGSAFGSEHDIFLHGPDKSFGAAELEGFLGVDLAGEGYGSLPEGHPFFESQEEE